ncbi:MAG TPA: hypothetical protein VFA41_17865 [Ktedonobacteraceae bacterium]|jgi:hypothetical protein|nr:hypothetical protein [Ktedonobacteraceae bacterium]
MRDDEYNSQNMRRSRREHGWIELFPLLFLLIFVFTQSMAGLIASLAIIFLLEVFIAAAPPGRSNTPSHLSARQQPSVPVYRPLVETPYEQGYQGVWSAPELLETNAPKEASQAEMTSESSRGEQPQLDYPQELPPMHS